jgi:hypothetical protein
MKYEWSNQLCCNKQIMKYEWLNQIRSINTQVMKSKSKKEVLSKQVTPHVSRLLTNLIWRGKLQEL